MPPLPTPLRLHRHTYMKCALTPTALFGRASGLAHTASSPSTLTSLRHAARLRSAAVPDVVLRIGVAGEKVVEAAGEVGRGFFGARLAVHVESLVRFGLHVVQLVRPIWMPGDIFPALFADRSA